MHLLPLAGGAGKQIEVFTSVRTGRCKPPVRLDDMIRIPALEQQKKKTPQAALRKEGAPMICLLSSTPHPTSLRSATFPSRGRLEERANQRLPLEGKLSAARLTDEVAGGLPCCFAPHNNSVLLRKIVVEPGYNHLKEYEIDVTIAVTPILFFWILWGQNPMLAITADKGVLVQT